MSKNILPYALPCMLALLPFTVIFIGEKTVPYFILIILMLLFFEGEKMQNFKLNKLVMIPFGIAVISFIVYTVLAPDLNLALKVLERQTSLLVIPLLIVFTNWNNRRIKLFFKSFIILLVLIGVFSIFFYLWFIITNYDWISYKTGQNNSLLVYLQYKFPHSIGVHPTYWSYLLVCGILALLSNNNLNLFKSKHVVITLLIFFNFNLLVLSARTPLFISLLVQVLFACSLIVKRRVSFKNQLIFIAIIIGCVLAISKLPLLTGKLSMVFEDERFYNWPFALQTISKNFFFLGEGLGQGNELIRRHIIENGDSRIRYMGYDLHNQYLRHYMDMGILGLISLLGLLLSPIYLLRKLREVDKGLYFSFFLFFSVTMMTESYLYRLKGIVFFSVVTSILLVKALGQMRLKETSKSNAKPNV